MKKILALLLVVLCYHQLAIAQDQALPKLSPLTRLYLQKVKKYVGQEYVPGYVYKNAAGGKLYISGMIKVSDANVDVQMKTLGVAIGTKAGNIWTTQIPVESVEQFTKLKGIEYIQLDEPAFPTLDSARRTTHVDSVHGAYGLWMPFTGNGVVAGIIDAGFDYSHPVFFDTTGNGFRVRKVWEEKTTGTPPTGFSYGNEMTDSVAMWAKGTDNGQTHGTHVAGITAGSGFGSSADGRRFRGMAFRSDLVFVGITPDKTQWLGTGVSDMVDGVNYIYQYAASVSKPAVVNLSWGSPLGPRDGSSLFNQAVDNLVGAGKIFVCSAGNNGTDALHVYKKFTATDSVLRTFLNIATSPVGKKTWVDVWGDTAKNFCVKVLLYNGAVGYDSTAYICLDNTIHSTYLIGSNNDTCFIDFTTSSSEFNNKPRIFMEFFSKVPDNVCISVKGTDGKINMWNAFVYNTSGYYGSFSSGSQPWAVNGNTDMTMSDLAVTKSAITVGAYASKVNYTNISGGTFSYSSYATRGSLVPFSSHGPDAQGRVMPFITGPGLTVGSAVSSYDTTFSPGGSSYSYVVNTYHKPSNNRDYSFGMLSGTSMSSPAVSGIVAMMLEANHNLTPQTIKDIMIQTAIKDGFTGSLTQPNNNWGYGKVNAYSSVKRAYETSSIYGVTHQSKNCTLFPNPSDGRFIIDYTAASNQLLTVNVYGVKGDLVASESWQAQAGANAKNFDFSRLGKGIYVTKVVAKEGIASIKTILQ